MKHLNSIVIVVLIILTSATTTSLITSKPAQAKYVIVEHFQDMGGFSERPRTLVPKYVHKKRKEGWILKSITGGRGHSGEAWFVVMEKY